MNKQITYNSFPYVALVCAAAFATLLCVSGYDQIVDPFIRHDDYPAFLLRPELYYHKTLTEGRWVNYWWQLRPFSSAAYLNQLIYLLGWAVFCGCTAVHVFGTGFKFYAILLAILLATSPQATEMSLWFNTLIPGVWIIAFYSILALMLPPLWGAVLLLVFVPLSLMAYSTYPLLLLGICMIRHDQPKTNNSLLLILAVFVVSFVLGLTTTFALNYLNHGVFGLEMADWRHPNPAKDFASLFGNLPKAFQFITGTLESTGFGNGLIAIVHILTLIASAIVLFAKSFREALFILVAMCMGFGLLVAHVLLEGTVVPFRATMFYWALFAVFAAKAACALHLSAPLIASFGRIALLCLAMISIILANNFISRQSTWQSETRRIAAQIPYDASKVFIYGSRWSLPGALEAQIFDDKGLRFRLLHLTGVDTRICHEEPDICSEVVSPFAQGASFEPMRIAVRNTEVFIRLPNIEAGP